MIISCRLIGTFRRSILRRMEPAREPRYRQALLSYRSVAARNCAEREQPISEQAPASIRSLHTNFDSRVSGSRVRSTDSMEFSCLAMAPSPIVVPNNLARIAYARTRRTQAESLDADDSAVSTIRVGCFHKLVSVTDHCRRLCGPKCPSSTGTFSHLLRSSHSTIAACTNRAGSSQNSRMTL